MALLAVFAEAVIEDALRQDVQRGRSPLIEPAQRMELQQLALAFIQVQNKHGA